MHPHRLCRTITLMLLLFSGVMSDTRAATTSNPPVATLTPPPAGSVILFNGQDLAQWTRPSGGPMWIVTNGIMTIRPGSGSIRTFQSFTDYQLHLEFRFPSNSPAGTAENSLANSGIFLQNQFEIQIIESYNRTFSGMNDGASIWGIRDAITNASLPGGSWESFDITYRAGRWTNGVKMENARVTVYWNGILAQDNAEIPRPTAGGAPPEQPPPGGIELQDLVGVVQFRNIWLLPLNDPVPPRPSSTTIIPSGSTWKYLDDGSNQGTVWRNPSFDDSTWKTGAAQFGYGDGDEVTLLRSNRADNSTIQSTYFRKAFVVSNQWALTNLNLGLLRDDGGIVYLNGSEIFRSNMTNAPTVYSTNWAVTSVGGADETSYFITNIPPSLLINGTNLLAIEIHQSSATSTDVSFDLWLTALAYAPPFLSVSHSSSGLDLLWPQVPGGFTLETSAILAPDASWTPDPTPVVSSNGLFKVTTSSGPGSRYYRLIRP